jgi:(4S)-4-hydroxy-5-phosphonooxypentane-2,3-dione isomerase
MNVVLVVTWLAQPGEQERLAGILRIMVRESRLEPGCIRYEANRSADDPGRFLIYEVYRDEAAQTAHEESEHFRRHIVEEALPRLESRERTFFQPV